LVNKYAFMESEIQLRPGVVYQGDSAGEGSIVFPEGRRVSNVHVSGTLPARSDDGKAARVHLLSALYPTSVEKIATREHLPALAVVAVETQYARGEPAIRGMLCSVFYLPFFVDGWCDFDPTRTVVLTMHGSVELDGDKMSAGSPSLPSVNPQHWLFLEPFSVAILVRRIRKLARPTAGGPH
jgi:hypothetical protein